MAILPNIGRITHIYYYRVSHLHVGAPPAEKQSVTKQLIMKEKINDQVPRPQTTFVKAVLHV